MNKGQFIQAVQLLASPEDFNYNRKKLDTIEVWLYDAFCNCLKLGLMIFQAEKIVKRADKLSKELALSPEEIIKLLPEFRFIVSLMDEKTQKN